MNGFDAFLLERNQPPNKTPNDSHIAVTITDKTVIGVWVDQATTQISPSEVSDTVANYLLSQQKYEADISST